MDKKLIVINKNEGRVGTFLISKGFERRHDHILELINRYQGDFEDFSRLERGKIKTKGRPVEEFLLNEDQFMFLGTLFRNSTVVVEFKKRLIKEFSRVRMQLIAAKVRQQEPIWIASRDLGKKQRRAMTDTLKDFVDYAKGQGSNNAERYYIHFSKMVYGPLFIFDGKYQSSRDFMSDEQLTTLASAEKIMAKSLRDCMKAKMFYKDIYLKIKSDVLAFAGLTGQTKVIEDQLKLKE